MLISVFLKQMNRKVTGYICLSSLITTALIHDFTLTITVLELLSHNPAVRLVPFSPLFWF